MIDHIADLLIVYATDVTLALASKRSRTVRLIRIVIGLVVVALIAGLIYITVRYS